MKSGIWRMLMAALPKQMIRTIEEKALLFIRRAFFYHEYSRRKYSGSAKDNEANLNQNQQKFRSAGGLFLYIRSA